MSDTIESILKTAHRQRAENRLEDARRSFTDALAAAENLNAEALKGLAQVERDLNQTGDALAHYQQAAAIYRKSNNALKLAHTIRHVADIYQDTGQPQQAEPHYREALEIYRGNKETKPLDLANTLRGLALLKGTDSALWQEAKDLYVQANVQAGVDECARRLKALKPS